MAFIEVTLEDGSTEFRNIHYDDLVREAQARDATTEPLNVLTPADVAAYEATQYQRNREKAYPSIGDQLDALWKGGAAAAEMLARVQSVKQQFPKPE